MNGPPVPPKETESGGGGVLWVESGEGVGGGGREVGKGEDTGNGEDLS